MFPHWFLLKYSCPSIVNSLISHIGHISMVTLQGILQNGAATLRAENIKEVRQVKRYDMNCLFVFYSKDGDLL